VCHGCLFPAVSLVAFPYSEPFGFVQHFYTVEMVMLLMMPDQQRQKHQMSLYTIDSVAGAEIVCLLLYSWGASGGRWRQLRCLISVQLVRRSWVFLPALSSRLIPGVLLAYRSSVLTLVHFAFSWLWLELWLSSNSTVHIRLTRKLHTKWETWAEYVAENLP